MLPLFAVLLLSILSQGVTASSHVTGTAVSCSDYYTCHYSITGTSGTGTASTYGGTISFQLPGEAQVSSGHWSTSSTSSPILGSFTAIDVNTNKLVRGTTNDTISAVRYCGPHGCWYVYHLVSGSITFVLTNIDATSTTVSCNPSTYNAGGHTVCTAKVTDLAKPSATPTGRITFSLGYGAMGTFNHNKCTLSSGSCSVTLSTPDEQVGGVVIYATYGGSSSEYPSSGSTEIYINST